jgi:hypothetical protein
LHSLSRLCKRNLGNTDASGAISALTLRSIDAIDTTSFVLLCSGTHRARSVRDQHTAVIFVTL